MTRALLRWPLLSALAIVLLLAAVAALATPAAPAIGALVTFTLDGARDRNCARVHSIGVGLRGAPEAIVITVNVPQWWARVPLDQLREGCSDR